jgi:hypothetical protein
MARRSVSFGTKTSISVSAAPPTLYLQTAPNLSSRHLSRQQTQRLSEDEKHANKHQNPPRSAKTAFNKPYLHASQSLYLRYPLLTELSNMGYTISKMQLPIFIDVE